MNQIMICVKSVAELSNKKMNFNPNLRKEASKIIFSRKTKNIAHPMQRFNNIFAFQGPHQKHLGTIPDI